MRSAVSSFELVEPRSLTDALRLMHEQAPLVPLAGCTDLYVALNAGALTGTWFINLWGLDELRGIGTRGDTLTLGALTTYTDIIRSPLVNRRVPMLVEAARQIGAVQVQNRGTLGGNIVNASPAGDALPVLAAAEATIVLRSVAGTRRVPFNSFYTAYRKTVMAPDELLVSVEVPPIDGRQWFRKVGTRAAQAISKVVMAAIRAPRPRIALGSVAPTVVRAPRTEEILGAGGSIEEASAALVREISPIDDLRSTAAYRRRVSANLLASFWKQTS